MLNIRETDAIGHVVRCFENDDIVHVAGKIDPQDDIDTINTELALADLDSCERAIQRLQKRAKGGDKDAKFELSVMEKILPVLSEAGMIRSVELDKDELLAIKSYNFLTLKPTMYIANVNEDGFENNPYLDRVREIAAKKEQLLFLYVLRLNLKLQNLMMKKKVEFLQDLGIEEPGLNRVIRAGYALLNLQTYFTAGVKEVRAWTVSVGATAPKAAAVIHTDFEKGFIRAEVIAYEDFIQFNGENGAKEAGKWRLEGKDYIVQDGDVMHFRFNV